MSEPITGSDEAVIDRPLNIPEYFLLLCLDEKKGRLLLDGPTAGMGIAGAAITELARRGRLEVTATTVRSIEHPEQVFAADRNPPVWARTPDLEWPLEQVWDIINAFTRHRDAEQWINRFSRQSLRDAVAASLVKRRIVEEGESTVLWIFHRTRYMERDHHFEQELRERIRAVLMDGSPADDLTWPLISLLRTTRLLHRLFPDVDKAHIRAAALTPTGSPATQQSMAEALLATENAVAEALTATTGGASALD
ncbi:GPP34 family phosphoprotein [Citricoccus nitrophenolicus]|uniref:GPP34 family phosphoprotein n=1 Tax=Citricoccus nitrophenolicus TaxID=863575 RepID=A0ABV0IDR0_9MICC|nr:GPP34 family phosphoprotein [Citricoccus sp. I39-566]WMY77251.1 GPP34 family phosphoprotein [Citricoccus sp. I39-566]